MSDNDIKIYEGSKSVNISSAVMSTFEAMNFHRENGNLLNIERGMIYETVQCKSQSHSFFGGDGCPFRRCGGADDAQLQRSVHAELYQA